MRGPRLLNALRYGMCMLCRPETDIVGRSTGVVMGQIESRPSLARRAWRFLFGSERRRQLRRAITGEGNPHWSRIVMDKETEKLVHSLPVPTLDVLEVSGTKWENTGFRSYRSVHYPEYDLCAGPLPETFDLVIAEQVFEHVLWPYRAARNVHEMLRPGGHFLISTPFLLRVHAAPLDCSRWTETGLKHLLAECGFPLEGIRTASWGNRACAIRNLRKDGKWASYRPWRDSLENEPDYPIVVWALARK